LDLPVILNPYVKLRSVGSVSVISHADQLFGDANYRRTVSYSHNKCKGRTCAIGRRRASRSYGVGNLSVAGTCIDQDIVDCSITTCFVAGYTSTRQVACPGKGCPRNKRSWSIISGGLTTANRHCGGTCNCRCRIYRNYHIG